MTYSHMATSHTTIGAERFHFRVRNGIGWFPLANAVRQKGNPESFVSTRVAFVNMNAESLCDNRKQNRLRLYGQASRAISTR